jgi:hypothetical protein
MKAYDYLFAYTFLFGPAAFYLILAWRAKNRSDGWFMFVAFGVFAAAFLLAHHDLQVAYAEKVVVGVNTEWDYVDHQGFLTTGPFLLRTGLPAREQVPRLALGAANRAAI